LCNELGKKASAKGAYPISGLTFLLIPKEPKNPDKGKTLKEFVQYIVTQGQNQAESLFYAKLPDALQQQDQNLLSQGGVQAMATGNTK
jgi:phosphate transport system substrate-binding protein